MPIVDHWQCFSRWHLPLTVSKLRRQAQPVTSASTAVHDRTECRALNDQAFSNIVIRNIAIATDFSPCSDRATLHALLVARQFGAAVHFLHVVRRSEFALIPDMMVELDALAQRDSDELIARLRAARELDSTDARCWNVDGEISEVFGDLIRDHRIDLLVLGTRGRSGISKFFSSSIAKEICHSVSCPVLTVGPWFCGASKQLLLNRVLFATDLSDESIAAIPYVLTAASIWNAEIDVLHVCSSCSSNQRRLMEEFGRAIEDIATPETSPSIHYHVLPGRPSDVVLDFARRNNEDLIVLGLDRHRSLYGGPSLCHAYEILRQATCPVLSVGSGEAARASGRESAI
jgi:nucleotide-binding universal stress UspA family protein